MATPLFEPKPEVSFFRKVLKEVYGENNLLNLEDTRNLIANKKEYFPNDVDMQNKIDKCEQMFQKKTVSCLFLGGALILSLQRYLPVGMTSLSPKKMLLDSTIVLTAMIGGVTYGSSGIQEYIQVIKRPLIIARDPKFLQHMSTLRKDYGLSYLQQIIQPLGYNQKDVQDWLAGRQILDLPKGDPNDRII